MVLMPLIINYNWFKAVRTLITAALLSIKIHVI